MTPSVTVYIPTHNRSELVVRAVRSVLAQDYPRIEVIVVLDHCTDDTDARLSELVVEDPAKRLQVLSLANDRRGACAARNVALWAATGEFITGLDDDDYFLPGRISGLVRGFDPTQNGFVFSGHRKRWRNGLGIIRETRVRPLVRLATHDELLKCNVVGSQVLTLTSRLREIDGFDESLLAWQDYDTWLRLVRRFGPGIAVDDQSYLSDQLAADAHRISRQLERINVAWRRFPELHPEYRNPSLASFLRLSRAAYGGRILFLRDVAQIAKTDSRYLLRGAYHYLRGWNMWW